MAHLRFSSPSNWPILNPSPTSYSASMSPGKIQPVVGETFPFGQAAEAHRYIPDRNNTGKVILTVR